MKKDYYRKVRRVRSLWIDRKRQGFASKEHKLAVREAFKMKLIEAKHYVSRIING